MINVLAGILGDPALLYSIYNAFGSLQHCCSATFSDS